MESTGAYWKPIYNILESNFEVILVNARHIKHVPGRKTDVKDAKWIAQLLQHGLLKASYIPEAPQRALRDLVRLNSRNAVRMKGVCPTIAQQWPPMDNG
jgi:transposase